MDPTLLASLASMGGSGGSGGAGGAGGAGGMGGGGAQNFIGPGLGMILGAMRQKEAEREALKNREMSATMMANSPWTGITPNFNFQEPSWINNLASGAIVGQQIQRGMSNPWAGQQASQPPVK